MSDTESVSAGVTPQMAGSPRSASLPDLTPWGGLSETSPGYLAVAVPERICAGLLRAPAGRAQRSL